MFFQSLASLLLCLTVFVLEEGAPSKTPLRQFDPRNNGDVDQEKKKEEGRKKTSHDSSSSFYSEVF